MAIQTEQTKHQLLAEIETSWVMLNSFLANLTRAQRNNIHDVQGWCVRDHITHITAWEESVIFFLQGKPRYEALGVEQSDFEQRSIDEINAMIQLNRRNLLFSEASAQLHAVHRRLLSLLAPLTETDLYKSLDSFHPEAKEGESRRVIDLIRDNTSGHFSEHLGWIEVLASRPE